MLTFIRKKPSSALRKNSKKHGKNRNKDLQPGIIYSTDLRFHII
jgi:hypothetical protein